MILQRLALSLKKRDWGLVLLEVLIVVVGIFIGLQVDDWNETRKERVETARFLERLSSDMTEMRDAIIGQRDKAQEIFENALVAFRILENCSIDGFEQAQAASAIENYQNVFTPQIFRSAYDEMLSAGALARLKNDRLKDQLSRAYAQMKFFETTVGFMRIDLSAAGHILWARVDFSFSEGVSSLVESVQAANLNLLEHCDDRLMRNAVWELVDTNRDWISVSQTSLQLIESALLALEKERDE